MESLSSCRRLKFERNSPGAVHGEWPSPILHAGAVHCSCWFQIDLVTSVTSVRWWCSQLDFRLNLMSWKGRWLNVSTLCTGASWQSFSGCYLVFQFTWDGPSELLFAVLVELYYRREMYVHIQQCFWSLTLLYMWSRCIWNQRWYRRANGLHISHLGINIEIRELHRFYKSNFPANWRFALCRIRAMKIGRWMEQCHGCVGNRENWWKPIAVTVVQVVLWV